MLIATKIFPGQYLCNVMGERKIYILRSRAMEKKNNCVKVGFSRILWGAMAILLCTAQGVLAQDVTVPSSTHPSPCDIDYTISGTLYVNGTANLLPGANIEWFVCATGTSVVNIKGGEVGWWIDVAPGAEVTVYGTGFEVNGVPQSEVPVDVKINGTLTGYYENSTTLFNLTFDCQSGATVTLAAPGSQPPENEPPVPDAGPDLTVFTKDIASTVIDGMATDPDAVDLLQYRWLEGVVEFTLWAPVGANGEAPLDLGTILPEYLGVGTHTLTLEVNDGTDTVQDDMVLTIEITVNVEIEKAKVSWDHSDIRLYGKLYLPQGFWMDTLDRVGGVVTTLADVNVVDQSVVFDLKGKDGKKWEYKDKGNIDGPIKEFKIDWKGAKFDYKGNEGLHIHTHHIGGTETTLCIHCDHISGAFTVSVNGTTIAYDEEKSVTTDLEYEPQKDDNTHVHFTLPLQLSPDMTIEVSGAVVLSIAVADYYEEGFVKFKLVSIFDPDFFPEGSETSPDELEIEISLGENPNTISGSDLIEAWTKQDDKHWEYK